MTQQYNPTTAEQLSPPGWDMQPAGPPRNGFGVTALCLSLVGLFFALLPLTGPLAAVLGILAVIFGSIGIARVKRGEASNRKMTNVGTGLGILAIALGILSTVLFAQTANAFVAGFNSAMAGQPVTSGSQQSVPSQNPLPPVAAQQPAPDYVAPSTVAAAPPVSYTYEVTGNYPAQFFSYTDSNGDSIATYQQQGDDAPHELPWRKTVEPEPNGGINSLGASTSSNRGNAWITCTVKDDQGGVISTETARGAYAQCYASSLGGF